LKDQLDKTQVAIAYLQKENGQLRPIVPQDKTTYDVKEKGKVMIDTEGMKDPISFSRIPRTRSIARVQQQEKEIMQSQVFYELTKFKEFLEKIERIQYQVDKIKERYCKDKLDLIGNIEVVTPTLGKAKDKQKWTLPVNRQAKNHMCKT